MSRLKIQQISYTGNLPYDPNLPDAPLLVDSNDATGYSRVYDAGEAPSSNNIVRAYWAFEKAIPFDAFYISMSRNAPTGYVTQYAFFGSNDNVTFTPLDSVSGVAPSASPLVRSFSSFGTLTYKYFRAQTSFTAAGSGPTVLPAFYEFRLSYGGVLYLPNVNYGSQHFNE